MDNIDLYKFNRLCIEMEKDVARNNNKENIMELEEFRLKDTSIIGVAEYMRHIHLNIKYNLSTVIISIIYICHIEDKYKTHVNNHTFHKLFLVAYTLAGKINEDIFYSNKTIAQCGGISLKNLNELESVFLQYIDFDLFVHEDDYNYLYNIL